MSPSETPRVRRRANGEGSVFKTTRHGCGAHKKGLGWPCGQAKAVECPDAVTVWRATETVGKDTAGRLIQVKGEGPTRAIALDRRYKNKVRRAVALGQLPPNALPLSREEKALTLQEWLADWLPSKHRLSEQTRAQYETRIRLYINPYLGSTPIRLLTPAQVKTHFTKTLPELKRKDGKPQLGATAIRGVYFILSQALDAAVKGGKVPLNVALSMEAPERTPKDKKKDRKLARLKSWVPLKLIEHLDGHPDEARWLCALFAMRQSEVLGLCDEQIISLRDKDKARIAIDQQLARRVAKHGCGTTADGSWKCGKQADDCPERIGQGGVYLKPDLKTEESERSLAVTEPLLSALRRHMKAQKELRKRPEFDPLPGMEKLVFTTPTGRPRREQQDRLEWKKILKEAGIEEELRVHDARHLAASLMMSLGVFTPDQLQKTGGWADMRTIKSVYSHQGAEYTREAVAAYGEKLMERRTAAKSKKQES